MFFCSQKIKGLLTYLLVLANNYGLLCTTKVLDTKLYLSRVDNRQLPNCMYMILNLNSPVRRLAGAFQIVSIQHDGITANA